MNYNSGADFNVALGKRITALRLKHCLTQERLGLLLGVKYQQVHKYETGENKMPPERILKTANLFRVSVGYLYGEENDTTPHLDADVLSTAMELMRMPKNIRLGIHGMAQEINRSLLLEESQKKSYKKIVFL